MRGPLAGAVYMLVLCGEIVAAWWWLRHLWRKFRELPVPQHVSDRRYARQHRYGQETNDAERAE